MDDSVMSDPLNGKGVNPFDIFPFNGYFSPGLVAVVLFLLFVIIVFMIAYALGNHTTRTPHHPR